MTSDSIHIMTLTRYLYLDYPYRRAIVDGISYQAARHLCLSPVLFSASILLTGIQIQESLQLILSFFVAKVCKIMKQCKIIYISLAFPGIINTVGMLLHSLEEKIYRPVFSKPFDNCQSLVEFSNSILNRRKSRAGKSLEHHLAEIFTASHIKFEEQVITENKKKPDFIFPDGESYHNFLFPSDKLTMLGAKTTCKDRWRQVLNEANRIPNKHLFTLQPGVSKNQLQEMKDEHLTLVVPKDNKKYFLPEFHDNIMSLSDFIVMVRERQSI